MSWRTGVEKDINDLDLKIEMLQNRNELIRRIHMDDHWSKYIRSWN